MAKTRKQRGGVCPCALGSSADLMRGGGSCSQSPLIRGGGPDSGMFAKIGGYINSFVGGGGGCGLQPINPLTAVYGGYRPTKKNRKTLRKYKQGKSIGFTALASLKAKGLIRRSNGTYKVSAKYLRK